MKHFSVIACGFALFSLTACEGGDVKNTLGLQRRAPDEFRVLSRPPLSVPPEFSLRPPAAPGETYPGGSVEPSYQKAESLLIGRDPGIMQLQEGNAETAVMPVSSGEIETMADSNFLAQAGVDKANPSIRSTLNAETATEAEMIEERGWLDKMNVFRTEDPVVNAEEEKARLEENAAEGKEVTEGETPMVQPKEKGPLGRLLGL